MAKGYRILAKRFRTPHGEIDIVARRRNLIVFIEVKARASLDDAGLCGDAAPAAAHHRCRARLADGPSRTRDFEFRFDAMLIAPRRLPRHLLAAFDASP